MKKIFSEKVKKIISKKENLEEALNVKITYRGKEVFIEGKSEDEYYAELVLDAMNFGFSFSHAILIKTEDFNLEILNIKDYTKRKDYASVRARIIGKGGKTLKVLSDLTDCYFEVNENRVGIIGSPEIMKKVQEAVILLIQGTKQSNVYSFLEKNRAKPIIDLGIK